LFNERFQLKAVDSKPVLTEWVRKVAESRDGNIRVVVARELNDAMTIGKRIIAQSIRSMPWSKKGSPF
jgi:hypothetical protein